MPFVTIGGVEPPKIQYSSKVARRVWHSRRSLEVVPPNG
jgi:hypothetical protein